MNRYGKGLYCKGDFLHQYADDIHGLAAALVDQLSQWCMPRGL